MGNLVVALDQKNVSVPIRILKDADGVPDTGVVAATAGQEIWYQRGLLVAAITDSGSAADLSAITDAHADWNFLHSREGWYRVDFPDAAFAAGVGKVLCSINATGFTGISVEVTIEPLFKFHGKASSVTATTTTFPAGQPPYKGDTIYVTDGTGITQTRLITAVAGQVATHLAWTINISATTSTILLIAGDTTLALGGINVDATVSSRSTLTAAQSNTEADTALTDYDLKALLPSALSAGGNIKADAQELNATTLLGIGQSGDKWRG